MYARLFISTFLLLSVSVSAMAGVKVSIPLQHWVTSQGTPVHFVQAKQVPMVDIQVIFNAGSARDGDKYGVAALTSALLDQGAGKFDANQIAEAFENVGAQFHYSVNNDMAVLSLRSLTSRAYLNRALMMYREVLSLPTFPSNSFHRLQKQALLFLAQQKQMPSSVGSKAFFQALYHKQAYGHPVLGAVSTVRALTRKDLVKFYEHYYVAKNANIVIVGDLTKTDAEHIAQRLADSLKVGEAAPNLPPMQSVKNGKILKIKFPSAQTHIYIGQIGIERSNPDYFALKVGNAVLGGGSVFSSRLYQVVRDQAGLVYHIGSYFDPWQAQGPFLINLQTRNEEAGTALELTKKVLTRFIKVGPTHKELKLVKNYMVNSFPLYLASNASLMANVSRIAFYKLPLDYISTYPSNIQKVTLKQVKAAFSKYVKPGQLTTIMVGNGSAKKQG